MNVLTNSNVDTTPIVDIITTVSPVSLVLLYGISRSAAAGASELKVLSLSLSFPIVILTNISHIYNRMLYLLVLLMVLFEK